MKYKRFTDDERLAILKEAETTNKSVAEICKSHGVSKTAFYKWKAYYEAPEKVYYKKDLRGRRSRVRYSTSGYSRKTMLQLAEQIEKASKLLRRISYEEMYSEKKRKR